ncbi:hypothetical protein [Streptomyces sp. enrichment culture]|uniref:hypothetical protein n=1 Tax=Streptomyces sp. enrichment culture TaxID=1795815 RepID=UPI003F54C25D
MEWLASVAPDPRACREQWEDNPFAAVLLPAGLRWDVLLVPGRLGYSAFDLLSRRVRTPGPVLADLGGTRTGFFVPPGSTHHRSHDAGRVAGFGTWICLPCPGHAARGTRWLVPPDGTGSLNEPAVVEAVLDAAAALLTPA